MNLKYPIKNIKPEYFMNINSDICFIYVYTPNIISYCKYSIDNLKIYCKKYNYGLIVYNELFNDDMAPCWSKVACILKNLEKFKYLVWFDADAIINNHNITIESIISLDNSKELYLTDNISMRSCGINSGIMIIKNTEWSKKLFINVWNSKFDHKHNDQEVLLYKITKEVYPKSKPTLFYNKYFDYNMHPKILISNQTLFNSHLLYFNKNDFILHLMSFTTEGRINIMKEINYNLGIYKKKYKIKILKNLNYFKKIYLIFKYHSKLNQNLKYNLILYLYEIKNNYLCYS